MRDIELVSKDHLQYRKPYSASPMVTWRLRHVTPKGQGDDPRIFEAPYLDKRDGWLKLTT